MNEINNAPKKLERIGLINIEKDVNIDKFSVLNDFGNSNRRINLIL